MKLYTKYGDGGYTHSLNNGKVKKYSSMIELGGDIDEANATIGYLSSLIADSKLDDYSLFVLSAMLLNVQNALYNIGVEVNTDFQCSKITKGHIALIETYIDELATVTPPQTEFILYQGVPAATYAQVARAVVRRAERTFARHMEGRTLPESYTYMNRLSDLLYVMGRYINHRLDVEEIPVKKF